MSKKIIGYKAPYEIYGHTTDFKINEGDVLVPDTTYPYYKKESWSGAFGGFLLAKEIVEKWEPVYETFTYKVGDYLMCEQELRMNVSGHQEFTPGKIYLSERDGCLTNNSGNKNHMMSQDLVNELFRLATPEEVSPAVTMILGSNNIKVEIKGGKIQGRGQMFELHKLIALLKAHPSEAFTDAGNYGFYYNKEVRFIRIGCAEENNLFSLNEIHEVVRIAKSQL